MAGLEITIPPWGGITTPVEDPSDPIGVPVMEEATPSFSELLQLAGCGQLAPDQALNLRFFLAEQEREE